MIDGIDRVKEKSKQINQAIDTVGERIDRNKKAVTKAS